MRLVLAVICLRFWALGQVFAADGHTDLRFQHNFGWNIKRIGNEVVYQILIDRFANGNTENDCWYHQRFCADGQVGDWYKYQGGDLAGIIARLPYLAELGVTRLWLTPIFENLQVTVDAQIAGQSVDITSYHGYWIKDWFRLNPFFTNHGTRDYAIVQDLISSAQALGIGIYLDTVANHTSPLNVSKWSIDLLNQVEPLEDSDGVPRSYRGSIFRDGQYVMSYDEDIHLSQKNPNRIPFFNQFERDIGDLNGDSDWTNPEIVQRYNLMGLADLNQDHSVVKDYLNEAHHFWLENFPALSGYRIDTIKHVSNQYWRYFSQLLYQAFPTLEVMGEYFGGGSRDGLAVEFYTQTQMSMLDFDFRDAMVDVFKYDASFRRILDVWANDGRLGDASGLFTYLDSHDYPRLRGQGLSYERMRLATAMWLVSRGIPCIYYGLEQDLHVEGDPGDPYNRPMMQSFDTDHDVFNLVQRLIALRKSNYALRYGETRVIHQTKHIIAFERIYDQHRVLFVGSKNPRTGSDNFSLQNVSLGDGTYRDVISGESYEVRDGKMPISIGYGEFIVLDNIGVQ